jgi:GR25 family glycosyltransferase involved in LPS biosynthesis
MCLRAALEADSPYAVVLQDDTVVCKNFTPALERIIEVYPDIPVCLFVSGNKTKTLRHYTNSMRAKWRYAPIWFQDYMPVVAVLWPRHKIEEFLEWSTDRKIKGLAEPYRSDDAVVGAWMKFTHQTVLATVPSLVQHPDDTLSVKWNAESKVPSGTGNKRRRAFWYIGDDDPLDLDWSRNLASRHT